MKERGLVQSQIIKAWNQCIQNDYRDQRINSERSLQASFWSYLNRLIPKTRYIFIEPSISVRINAKTEKFFPDLIVCNTKEVIAIIELKYQPRVHPNFKKDVNKLGILAKYRNKLTVSNERFRGIPAKNKKFAFSRNILFVWAGIHAGIIDEIPIQKELQGSFLELHAQTTRDENPKVRHKSQ